MFGWIKKKEVSEEVLTNKIRGRMRFALMKRQSLHTEYVIDTLVVNGSKYQNVYRLVAKSIKEKYPSETNDIVFFVDHSVYAYTPFKRVEYSEGKTFKEVDYGFTDSNIGAIIDQWLDLIERKS